MLARAIDTADHQYRVTVDDAGTARLFVDQDDSGVEWTIPADAGPRRSAVFVSGTASSPSAASLEWLSVEDNVLSTPWDDLSGWTPYNGGGSIVGGHLTMQSTATGQRAVTHLVDTRCDVTVDFRGEVTDYSTLNPANGRGASMAMLVSNGSRRLMLSIQQDGVYAIPKSQTDWVKVYSRANAGTLASWRVDTSSGGEAKLFRDGVDTGARWTIQDNDVAPQVRIWADGNNGDTSAFRMDWIRTTCEIR